MTWENSFPASFDVGDPNGGHMHFDASGTKWYAPDGTTVQVRYDTATGAFTFVGSITGGSITGATISGGTISGATISGNTITGGSISGATVSGVTITGSTIIGGTIETATSGARITLDTSFLVFYNSAGSNVAEISPTSTGISIAMLGSASVLAVAGDISASGPPGSGNISGAAFSCSSLTSSGTIRGTDCNHLIDAQSGIDTSISMGAGTGTASTTVTFPRSFASAPRVVVTVGTTAGGTVMTTRVTSVTSSSFQVTLDRAVTTTAVSNVPVHWHALLTN